jgi:hypothetical protein
VPLSPDGDRLLQVIANVGGAQPPVAVRGGVTATIPLQQLVSNPGEDIYVEPGDVLTFIRLPQIFSRIPLRETHRHPDLRDHSLARRVGGDARIGRIERNHRNRRARGQRRV